MSLPHPVGLCLNQSVGWTCFQRALHQRGRKRVPGSGDTCSQGARLSLQGALYPRWPLWPGGVFELQEQADLNGLSF